MSGLQTIIDKCNGITINRRKVAGVQITNNEIPRTVFTPTKQPWRFVLDMPASLRYNEARALLENLDTIDRITPQVVTFGNNPCLNWIFRYQGALTSSELNALRVSSFSGNQLVLTDLPGVGSSTIMFEPNDLIQIGSTTTTNPYPFTSTTQVLRGTGSTITITTNRPNILTTNITSSPITVGNACYFRLFCPNMPVYKLTPGGFVRGQFGQTVNNALIEFSNSFELFEWVGGA
jgi:hypothetical protein